MIRRAAMVILGGLIALYCAYAIAMVVLHPRFIYPFFQDPFVHPAFEARSIPVDGAADLTVHVAQGQAGAPLVVYFMGNVGTLDAFAPMLDLHVAQGRSVIAMTYRGGGGEDGTPSEAALKRDALASVVAARSLVPDAGALIVQGYSLGTGLAQHVAARVEVDGVILSAPYDQLCTLMAARSFLPACVLPVQKWQSSKDAPNISVPTLILHGTADGLIPIAQGKKLADRYVAVQPRFVPIQGAGHTDLLAYPEYVQEMDAFIARFAP